MTKKARTYRIPEDTLDKLEALSKARGKNQTDTIIDLIENAEATDIPRYQWLDDACPLLYHLNEQEAPKQGEGFYCLAGSPKVTKLGSGIDTAAKKYCKACQFKKGILKQNELMTKQLKDGFTVRIPFCTNGGKLTTDLQRIWCPISSDYKTVTKCKTLRNGANCKHLRWIDAEAKQPQTSTNQRR